jgi:pyruvate/2-oxoglutarate dehydrogenase complex dihydrolipoamide dehydrogenase (E3) component
MGAETPRVLPDDEYNRALVAEVRPPAWENPEPAGRYNLVVVGAGTAGLVAAAGAAGLGARVALVERHLLGGDCLNVGCVPSKALIAAGRAAADARQAADLGVQVAGVDVDFLAVMARLRRLRARLAPTDGARRFAGLGVDVFFGSGRFTGPTTLEVDGRRLEFARAAVTTGARATAPPIAGLEAAGYLTNETVFTLTELPRRLVVIGAGPIGCELAQAFARLGSRVTALEQGAQVLGREDPDAAALVAERLRRDGVEVVLGARITHAARRDGERVVGFDGGGATREVACDAILVGAGRAPNVEGLGLEAAGIAFGRDGVTVNDFLQTTNPRVYAAGDVATRFRFTHMADALARIVVQNALFAGRKKASAVTVPWCTYTTPEVAHVGLSARDAAERGLAIDTITVRLGEVDRAVLEGAEDGFLRVHLRAGRDRILGATLVGAHAGETISELTLAMTRGIGLGALASVVHPYPTVAEAIRKAGDAYNRTRLTPTVKRLFRWWLAARR